MKKDLKSLVKTILKKKIYILLITIIFAVVGIVFMLTDTKYVADNKILIADKDANMLDTYKELITGSTVLDEVLSNLNGDMDYNELINNMNVNVIDNTNVIEVRIIGKNSEIIKKTADEVTRVFLENVAKIYNNKELYQVDSSVREYGNIGVAIGGALCALAGFLGTCLFFSICFFMDTKIKSSKEIEEITGLKSLISIPNAKPINKKRLSINTLSSYNSDIFKLFMTNIQFVNVNNTGSKAILITSPRAKEGKSYVANNLAIKFAKAGKKVILIDADMRKGRLAKIYNLPNNLGFSNYLSNLDTNGNILHEMITKFINDTEIKNLNVITSGNIPPNPAELLKNGKMEELVKDLKVFYDIIIFDSVPILEAQEAEILTQFCDLTLILSAYKSTKTADFIQAYEKIKTREGSVIGLAINKVHFEIKNRKAWILKNKIISFFKKIRIWI